VLPLVLLAATLARPGGRLAEFGFGGGVVGGTGIAKYGGNICS
jgi:hypothetical protein